MPNKLSGQEWNSFSNDFLFLNKPKKICETGTGTLLLDEEFKHKLYVKGFFISNMKDDGLLWGVIAGNDVFLVIFKVNLHELQIDRDRYAYRVFSGR
jgi:hypothetical protein